MHRRCANIAAEEWQCVLQQCLLIPYKRHNKQTDAALFIHCSLMNPQGLLSINLMVVTAHA